MLRGPARVHRRQVGLHPHRLGPLSPPLLVAVLLDGLLAAGFLGLPGLDYFEHYGFAMLLRGPPSGPTLLDLLLVLAAAAGAWALLRAAFLVRRRRPGSLVVALTLVAVSIWGIVGLSRTPTREDVIRYVHRETYRHTDGVRLLYRWGWPIRLTEARWPEARPFFRNLLRRRRDPGFALLGALCLHRLGDRYPEVRMGLARGIDWMGEHVEPRRGVKGLPFLSFEVAEFWRIVTGQAFSTREQRELFCAGSPFWT